MLAILPVPGRLKAATRVIERGAALGGASSGSVKCFGQVRDLRGTTRLETLIDRPGITASFGDQRRDAYVAQLNPTANNIAFLSQTVIDATPAYLVARLNPNVAAMVLQLLPLAHPADMPHVIR